MTSLSVQIEIQSDMMLDGLGNFGSSPNYQLPDCHNSTLKSLNHPSPPGLLYDAIPCHSHKIITQCEFHTHGHKATCPNPLTQHVCFQVHTATSGTSLNFQMLTV